MRKIWGLTLILIMLAGLIAGCGGGGGGTKAQRITGLTPEKVVVTFHERAKNQKYEEASLYVSLTSLEAIKGVGNFLRHDLGLSDVLTSNLLSAKLMGEKGDYAVVLATFQDGTNSTKISVKPIGMEKVKGEWYIVDNKTIFQNAKYRLLQDLIDDVL